MRSARSDQSGNDSAHFIFKKHRTELRVEDGDQLLYKVLKKEGYQQPIVIAEFTLVLRILNQIGRNDKEARTRKGRYEHALTIKGIN